MRSTRPTMPAWPLRKKRPSRDSLPVSSRVNERVAWYAVWTRSRHEQVVCEQIERKQYDAFLPTITRWSRWKDRKKKIDWPLFPGYCFAKFDPAEALAILKCTG